MDDEKNCKDENCPKHGTLRVRGAVIKGIVVSTKPKKTAIIRIDYSRKIPKYERLEKRRSRIAVHVPSCMKAEVGQTVTAGECRKVSKTKAFVLLPEGEDKASKEKKA